MRGKAFLAAVLAVAVAAPASASTFIRAGLDQLVASNRKVVVGDVLDVHSYWNQDGTLILTDVRFVASDVLKGDLGDRDFTITLPGGVIGDQEHRIIGAAELIPGKSYVLFLEEASLPGAARAWTVRDHIQGAFELRMAKDGLRAVSQAARHPLVPDQKGMTEPPGGREGLPFNTMVNMIRQIAARGKARQEVQ